MHVNDALLWMTRVESLYNGTPESARLVQELSLVLIADPENFPDRFFEATNPPVPIAAEVLIMGDITPESTFADLQRLTSEKGRYDAA